MGGMEAFKLPDLPSAEVPIGKLSLLPPVQSP
jgi:hypothetical protein